LKTVHIQSIYLSESENPLLGAHAAALDHDEVLLDLAVVGESTHRVDGLVGQVVIGRGVVLDQLSVFGVVSVSHVVDLLVDLGTVVVTLLTSSGDGELDAGRMPGTDASDLAETLVRLARKLLRVPTGGDA